MNRQQCIYRKSKGCGTRCKEACSASSGFFCSGHRKSASELQMAIHEGLGNDIDTITDKTITLFIFRLLAHSRPPQLIEEALSYLMTSFELWSITRPIMHLTVTMRKTDIAQRLIAHYQKLYQIQVAPKRLTAIVALQKRWKQHMLTRTDTLRGPWPTAPAVNDTDPFTLEDLNDLPKQEVFSYRDEDGRVFAFHAPELECAIRQGQHVNPYTQKPIPKHEIQRLMRLMQYLPKVILPFPPDTWKTANDAYQDVSGEYQRLFGIYVQPEWLLCLTNEDIEYIFYTYHVRTQNTSQHMSIRRLLNRPCKPWGEHKYILAHEMWRLSEDNAHPYHMFWMCMLLITITEVSPDMVLPDWVFSIV